METYFEYKLIFEFIVPMIFISATTILVILCVFIELCNKLRKELNKLRQRNRKDKK